VATLLPDAVELAANRTSLSKVISMQAQGTPADVATPVPIGVQAGKVVVGVNTPAQPSEIYQAFKAQRRELGRQLENLEEKRGELRQRLEQGTVSDVDKKGIETRLTEIDQRIADVDKAITAADAQVAKSAAIPGATVEPPQPRREGPPEEAFVLGGMFMVIVLLPMSIAMARRLWRRGAQVVATIPQELSERFSRLEQGVEAIAVEVERIGEGQRFMTKVFAEEGPRQLGEGAAQPLDVRQREAVHQQVRR
jgi:hypothetical protein